MIGEALKQKQKEDENMLERQISQWSALQFGKNKH